ncbi:hypothetical protein WQE_44188 [Paraburkholderia hospita]|jgi:hypothetical protein|uniref:Uncharacterized protein n=1 Tax=Paraburkholderia hospita TaxID=169430 RepID=A0ABP2P9P4_9BURK|nr:hypothetical protein [Paraburkholderia hospita]EIM94449.1 hypothetical protein WQE_44188 [Paraburkholderia hospita]OUL73300.1 hypothetical protein CA601_44205 [Paraburkholderia hospita]OUL80592.1 hypothetical protein CA602_27640 [Paraburkholderia hospita]
MFRKITIPLNKILEPKREHAMPQVEVIQFDDVPEDGLIDEGALVPVNGMLAMSPPDGGCGMAGCGCFRGHFITRLFRRDDEGCVRGYVVEFESRQELETTSPEELSVLVSRAMN